MRVKSSVSVCTGGAAAGGGGFFLVRERGHKPAHFFHSLDAQGGRIGFTGGIIASFDSVENASLSLQVKRVCVCMYLRVN